MKYRAIMLSAIFFTVASVFAQAPSQSSPPPQHQPGIAAPSAQSQAKPQVPSTTPGAAPAKVDPEKEKAILHLMQITGASKDGDNMTMLLSTQVKNAVSRSLTGDRLQKFVDDFNSKLSAKSPSNEVTTAEVAIYAQNFSTEDLQGMIQFYESPVGQRVMKALPQVLQQTQREGATIERAAALNTLREMTGDYPEIKPLLPDEQRPTLAPGTQPQQQPKPESQPPKPQTQPQQPQR
jgi:uncharacterized protein